jgi:hypothetical protein
MTQNLGDLISVKNIKVFFGNRLATLETLSVRFPELKFLTLSQTHSNTVVHSPCHESTVADAHFT